MKRFLVKLGTRIATLFLGAFVLTSAAAAHPPVPVDQYVVINRVEVPTNQHMQALVQLAMHREVQAVRAAVQRQHHLEVSHISWSPEKVVVIGHRLVHQQDNGLRATMWLEQVRVTVPRHYLASTWDVNALQRELERLGIKVKPAPQAPKPTQQLSG